MASPLVNAENVQQCNQKLYNTLYDRAPTQIELEAANPLTRVDAMLANDAFQDFFARYINAKLNTGPADKPEDEVVFNMVKSYILKRDKDWAELFTAKVDIVGQNINPKPDAVGYFESRSWKKRYAGNEEEGLKLRTAYMVTNNIIGLKLDALTVTSSGDSSKKGRADPSNVCISCHFNLPFALDKVALILDRVDRKASDAQNTLFLPPIGPAQVIYGESVANLTELANMLVKRSEFNSNACHMAFTFVFGRDESAHEKQLFSQCMEKFTASKKITTAVKHFVESDIFCQGLGAQG